VAVSVIVVLPIVVDAATVCEDIEKLSHSVIQMG
jgi:hypothetical protein